MPEQGEFVDFEALTIVFEEIAHSHEGQVILVFAPIVFLVLLATVYGTYAYFHRKKEAAELAKEMNQPEDLGDSEDTHASPQPKAPAPAESIPAPAPPSEAKQTLEPQSSTPQPLQAPQDVEEILQVDQASWIKKLQSGLKKTRDSLTTNLSQIFTGKVKIDDDVLEQLHEQLYRADVGVKTSDRLVDKVRTVLSKDEAAEWDQVRDCLKTEAKEILEGPTNIPLNQQASGPWVILVVGVNGVGKTTSIGKLTAHFLSQNKKVMLAAADTFRAAAIDQLQVWADRLGVDVVKHKQGSDPAAVAYDGVKSAMAKNADVLIIDTAGRLHNKGELMKELEKINKVIGRDCEGAPHETWLVIDATTGQNAVLQVKAFSEVVKISGLIVTKLDGTAKGGVLVGIADQFKLPIRYVGVGEKAADLRTFKADEFVDSMF